MEKKLNGNEETTKITPVEEVPIKTGGEQEKPYIRRLEDGRFPPGVSGNPTGRPKGAKHFKTLFIEAVKEVGAKDGSGKDISKDKVIVKRFVDKAMAGDFKYGSYIMDKIDGDKEDSPLLNINILALTQEEKDGLLKLI